jgi:hypothetical protein
MVEVVALGAELLTGFYAMDAAASVACQWRHYGNGEGITHAIAARRLPTPHRSGYDAVGGKTAWLKTPRM